MSPKLTESYVFDYSTHTEDDAYNLTSFSREKSKLCQKLLLSICSIT